MSDLVQALLWLTVWMTLWLGAWLLIGAAVFALLLPLLTSSLYLLGLTLLSGRPKPCPEAPQRLRLDIVVPAHDEAALIGRTVASLLAVSWPAARRRVCVVADNCSDDTAARARAAGAVVWTRDDPGLRGKGHALAHGFEASRRDGWADAVVVVDADSIVSANLLQACADRIEHGAQVVQVHHGVLNVQDSWRTRLMAIALEAFHRVRSRGRERLGLSCGLRGNGWSATHALLQRVPYRAWSLAEDIEFGLDLGLAGVRVHHADEASVDSQMVNGAAAAVSQRRRWEDGRWQLRRDRLGELGRAALGPGRPVAVRWICLDLAMDLVVPPLATLVLMAGLLLFIGGIGLLVDLAGTGGVVAALVWLALGSFAALALHVLRGWQLSGVGWRGLADLAHVPSYVVWKVLLLVRAHDSAEWVRTLRERT
ncbi:glycosyltransferase family 2 protein [Leptothrix discophora]|uniref:Glycosyltransferase n=1 Tax=Leptothrix discophora TaxID=89 RepID=A0ABT9G8K3_LEPDI|nr:glycosyltransferase [Leptothrix discophora]MDP4302819.1 glycosyltransferase [Leptothrix discophora]